MRRLHVQFYLAILAALAVFLLASGLFWRFSGERDGAALRVSTAAQIGQLLLPPASASVAEQQRSIVSWQLRPGSRGPGPELQTW